jgi:hypothetical protein
VIGGPAGGQAGAPEPRGIRKLTPRRVQGEAYRTAFLGRAAVAALLLSASPTVRLSAQAVPKTIKPGMTELEVRAIWGNPLTVRNAGAMTFLYFRNDCSRCGTHDVVFLEGGQVIDAVVRDSHRRYDGVSSSPVERKPEATRP